MRYRLRTLLIVVGLSPIALAALAPSFLTLPLRDSDKVDAARSLVAWFLENRPIPGSNAEFGDAKWMRDNKSFLVVCDFVPAGTRISDDARVRVVGRDEFDRAVKNPDFPSTAYIELLFKTDSRQLLVVEASNYHGSLAAQGYRFEFRRKVWGLRAWGKLLWCS